MINAPSLANCGLFTMAEEMDGMIRGGDRHKTRVDVL